LGQPHGCLVRQLESLEKSFVAGCMSVLSKKEAARPRVKQEAEASTGNAMKLVITEVTEMSAGNYCVAGWHVQSGRMVRPLPNGSNWTEALLHKYSVAPGAVLNFVQTGVAHHSVFPHHTEDMPVDAASITIASTTPGPWFGQSAPPCASTLADAFQGHVQHNSVWNGVFQGVHVPVGTQTRSLWAVQCTRGSLTLIEDFGKLKGELHDGAGTYKLSISSQVLKTHYRNGGLAAVVKALPKSGTLHVRVGLARAFGNPAYKCYVMINGVQW
jgi:hypothetical protein